MRQFLLNFAYSHIYFHDLSFRPRPSMSEHHRKTATLPSANPSKSFWHVEPSALLLGHRSTRDLPEQADVVIVGSGITGTSVAWHLLQNGDNSKTSETGDELNIVMMEAREACWGATGRVSIL